MANATPVVSPADVVKIIAYSQNADGTLSPTVLANTGSPKILPVDVAPVQFFTQNGDGTLSPANIS
jgi:hypothetical protein